jgi:hypothetical protein
VTEFESRLKLLDQLDIDVVPALVLPLTRPRRR